MKFAFAASVLGRVARAFIGFTEQTGAARRVFYASARYKERLKLPASSSTNRVISGRALSEIFPRPCISGTSVHSPGCNDRRANLGIGKAERQADCPVRGGSTLQQGRCSMPAPARRAVVILGDQLWGISYGRRGPATYHAMCRSLYDRKPRA